MLECANIKHSGKRISGSLPGTVGTLTVCKGTNSGYASVVYTAEAPPCR